MNERLHPEPAVQQFSAKPVTNCAVRFEAKDLSKKPKKPTGGMGRMGLALLTFQVFTFLNNSAQTANALANPDATQAQLLKNFMDEYQKTLQLQEAQGYPDKNQLELTVRASAH